jgi:hypothetical protein
MRRLYTSPNPWTGVLREKRSSHYRRLETTARYAPVACSKVSANDMFVMLDRSDSFLYLYNNKGLLSLPEGDAETVRFRECQGYLDRD